MLIGIEDQLRKSKFLGHLPLHCLPFDFLWNQFWISRSTRPIKPHFPLWIMWALVKSHTSPPFPLRGPVSTPLERASGCPGAIPYWYLSVFRNHHLCMGKKGMFNILTMISVNAVIERMLGNLAVKPWQSNHLSKCCNQEDAKVTQQSSQDLYVSSVSYLQLQTYTSSERRQVWCPCIPNMSPSHPPVLLAGPA